MNKKMLSCVLGMTCLMGLASLFFINHKELTDHSETQFYVLEKVSQKYYKENVVSADVYEQFLLSKVKGDDLTGSAPAYLSLFYGHKGRYEARDELLMQGISSYPALELYNLLSANLPIFDIGKQSEIASLARDPGVSASRVKKALSSTATYLGPEEIKKLRQCYEILGGSKSDFEDPLSWKNAFFHSEFKSPCSHL